MRINGGNILVTSISRKVPLIKAVKEAVRKLNPSLKVIGADVDKNIVGRYFVDEFWHMPLLSKLNIDDVINYCHLHKIAFIIPTRDGELKFFACHKVKLLEHGIHTMISPIDSVDVCLDKLLFYKTLAENGYPGIPTYQSIDQLIQNEFYVVKERFGAGAMSVGINLDIKKAIEHAHLLESPIYQPMIKGIEISVDLYIDNQGKTKGVICRTRDKIISGESQITSTISNADLEDLCSNIAEKLNLYGHIMFQIIVDNNNIFHIIECNCRFGGASTLSVAAGLDSFYWFLQESMGECLDQVAFNRSEMEWTMIRYPTDYIF